MRIGIIVYGLDRPLTGIGRYIYELVRAQSTLDDALELVLLRAGDLGPLSICQNLAQVSLPGCRLLPGLMTLGNLYLPLLSRRLGLDLVHDPIGVTPFGLGCGGAARVVTVHDVFAWSLPGTSSLLDTLIYKSWLPRVLPRVQAVITVSTQSRQDIQHYLGIPAAQTRVIPYGVAPRFVPLEPEGVRQQLGRRFGLNGPYILYVGALTLRKNIARALEAFSELSSSHPDLRFVLAGPSTWKKTPVALLLERLGIADRVLLTGPLTDDDLPALYSGASLFTFPSLYEGFGLPPLEAMACGTPVVTSNVSSLPEVVGDAALTVDPYDVGALAEAMRRVLSDPGLRDDMRQKGLDRARCFTWERTARETLSVYRQVLAL